jgi:PEP-CTERM motif-containing protein
MRKTFAAAAVMAGLTAISLPASAATLLTSGVSGTPLTETLMNNPGVDGTSITFLSSTHNLAIDFNSPDVLHSSSTGGFAFVEGEGTKFGDGFSQLSIVPETVTFQAFKFNLMLPAPNGPDFTSKTVFTYDMRVDFAGGGFQLFNDIGADSSGQNRSLLLAGAGQAISEIDFLNLQGVTGNGDPISYNFDSLRQMSFNYTGGAVPEPATWALFILGFGFVGAMLRSARSKQSAALAA